MSSAQTMKIFSIINRMKQELEESPKTKFGTPSKRVVEIDIMLDLLEDLKVVIPEDIRRATGIIAEAENTIRDAKDNADDIIEAANQEADKIMQQARQQADGLYEQANTEFEKRVSESEVYKEAFERANKVSGEAESDANAIYNGARKYADDVLSDLQRYLAEYHRMIDQNRIELGMTAQQAQPAPQPVYQQPVQEQSIPQPVYQAQQPIYQQQPMQEQYYAPQPQQQQQAMPMQDQRMANAGVYGYQQTLQDEEQDPMATRQFQRPSERRGRAADMEAAPRKNAFRDEEDEDDAPPVKKKGLFKRILEAADDEDEYDDEDEFDEPEPAPKKQPKAKKAKKRLIEFIEDEDDEDEDEDY